MKKRTKILIWGTGILICICIGYFPSEEPDFISENGLVTWHAVITWFVIFWCVLSTAKKPFWRLVDEENEERIKESENRIAKLVESLEELYSLLDKSEVFKTSRQNLQERIDKLKNDLGEYHSRLESKMTAFETKLDNLQFCFSEHVSDYKIKYECQGCGQKTDDVFGSLSDDKICDACHMPNYFTAVNKAHSRHT